MENQDELEVFKGLGADEIDKKDTGFKVNDDVLKEFDLNGDGIVTKEEIDEVKLRLQKEIENDKKYIKQSYLEAYEKLDKDIQSQISKDDIESLINGKFVNKESILKLQEERKKLLEDKDKELFDRFNNALGGDISKNTLLWKKIKRSILVGVIFGIPGALIVGIKDLVDEHMVKNAIKEGTEVLAKTGNVDKIDEAGKIAYKYVGGIVDTKQLIENIKASDTLINLQENEKGIKEIVIGEKETRKNLEIYLEEIDKETSTEKIENAEEIEEDNEDPEPVEGMKFM